MKNAAHATESTRRPVSLAGPLSKAGWMLFITHVPCFVEDRDSCSGLAVCVDLDQASMLVGSELGQSRRFEAAPMMSDLPLMTDI